MLLNVFTELPKYKIIVFSTNKGAEKDNTDDVELIFGDLKKSL